MMIKSFLISAACLLCGFCQVRATSSFKFTKIFFVGGRCEDPESWYSQWAAAGLASIDNITHHYCSPFEDGQYSEYTVKFHSKALISAMREAGEEKNTSLIITGAFAGVDYDAALAEVLRNGMAVFQGDGVEFNKTKFNLPSDQVLYLRLVYEEKFSTSTEIGKELCRLKGSKTRLKIAKFYMEDRPDLDFRVDNVLKAFSYFCPGVLVSEVWSLRGERTQIVGDAELKFAFKEPPDLIVTPTDDDAANLLSIAERVLTPEQYDTLQATGWDNKRSDLLDQRKIITTADHMVFYPHEGFWRSVEALISSVQIKALRSTAAIQKQLQLGDSMSLNSTVLAISSDKAGFVLAGLLEAYDPHSAPSSQLNVSTGIYDLSVTDVLPFEGRYDTVFWLTMAWEDPRLAWNPFLYNGTLVVDKDQIWYPRLLHFKNEYSQTLIYQRPAVVSYDGKVTLDVNLQSVFLCDTVRWVRKYPFDEFPCSMDLGGGGNALIVNQDLGFDLIASDPHFTTTTTTNKGVDEQGETILLYELYFTRNEFSAWVRLIVPGFVINMIGFMAFWIPSQAVGLGITALLCTLAFRETVEIPDTSGVTWSESFMVINVTYQAIAVFITFCSFCWLGKEINRILWCLRPKDKEEEEKKDSTEGEVSSNRDTSNSSGQSTSPVAVQRGDKEPEIKVAGTTNLGGVDEESGTLTQTESSNQTVAPIVVKGVDVTSPAAGVRQRRAAVTSDHDGVNIRRSGTQKPLDRRELGIKQLGFFETPVASEEDEKKKKIRHEQSIDWLGRLFVVPSYFVLFVFMVVWGPKVF